MLLAAFICPLFTSNQLKYAVFYFCLFCTKTMKFKKIGKNSRTLLWKSKKKLVCKVFNYKHVVIVTQNFLANNYYNFQISFQIFSN